MGNVFEIMRIGELVAEGARLKCDSIEYKLIYYDVGEPEDYSDEEIENDLSCKEKYTGCCAFTHESLRTFLNCSKVADGDIYPIQAFIEAMFLGGGLYRDDTVKAHVKRLYSVFMYPRYVDELDAKDFHDRQLELINLFASAVNCGDRDYLTETVELFLKDYDWEDKNGNFLGLATTRIDWSRMESEYFDVTVKCIDKLRRKVKGQSIAHYWEEVFLRIVRSDVDVEVLYKVLKKLPQMACYDFIRKLIIDSEYDQQLSVDAYFARLVEPIVRCGEGLDVVSLNLFARLKQLGSDYATRNVINIIHRFWEVYGVGVTNKGYHELEAALGCGDKAFVYEVIEKGAHPIMIEFMSGVGNSELVQEVKQLIPIFKIFETAGIADVTIYRHLYRDPRCIRAAVSEVASSIEDLERYYSSSGVTTSEERRL